MQKGFHLTLDGFACSKEPLDDLETVYHFLERAPDLIGMKKLMPPRTIKHQPPGEEDEWGITGFVVVAESHISIHTYPERAYLALDIYSCKEFDLESAICYARRLFGVKEVVLNYLERGLAVRGKPGNVEMSQLFGNKGGKTLDRAVRAI